MKSKISIITIVTASLFILFALAWIILKPKIETHRSELLIISSDLNNSHKYYTYSPISNKNKEILITSPQKSYPTGILSNNEDILYLTKTDENGETQLFKRILKTEKETQLTSEKKNGIANVDFVRLDSNKSAMYLRVVQTGHHNFNLGVYNIKTGKLTILNEKETDLSDQFFDFTNNHEGLLVAQYSLAQKYQVMDKANISQNFNNAATQYSFLLKSFSGNVISNFGVLNRNIVDISISPDGNSAAILTQDLSGKNIINVTSSLIYMKFEAKKTTETVTPPPEINVFKQVCFDSSGEGFYFVATADSINASSKHYVLYYYNLKEKKSHKVLDIKNETIISCTNLLK